MNQVVEVLGTLLMGEVSGSGYPLILVHGHPFDRSMWNPQIEALQTHYKVITFDLRGYGASESSASYVPLHRFAEDIEAIRQALQLEQFALAGLSMGGQIALEYYRCYPQRVGALLLLDTFATLDSAAGQQQRRDNADRITRYGMAAYAAELLPGMVAAATIEHQPAVADFVLRMMQAAPPTGAAAALRGRADRLDYTALLPTIQVPVLVLVGSEDAFTPVADAAFMQERIPGAQLAVLQGVGHLPTLEAPVECTEIIAEFLSRHFPLQA